MGRDVKKLTEALDNLFVESDAKDKKLEEVTAAASKYAAKLATGTAKYTNKRDEVEQLQAKLHDLNNVMNGVGDEDSSPPASVTAAAEDQLETHTLEMGSPAANFAYAKSAKKSIYFKHMYLPPTRPLTPRCYQHHEQRHGRGRQVAKI